VSNEVVVAKVPKRWTPQIRLLLFQA
jgi:hypothetical protein